MREAPNYPDNNPYPSISERCQDLRNLCAHVSIRVVFNVFFIIINVAKISNDEQFQNIVTMLSYRSITYSATHA